MLFRIFPFLESLKSYNAAKFRADAISGLTVALVLIPQSMAYAQLGGLPAYYGLYASFLPPMIAALFGSSRQLATGPVETSNWDAPTLAGCGSIMSTANDLLTFLAANMGITDTELRPALQLANTPQRPGEIGLWPTSDLAGIYLDPALGFTTMAEEGLATVRSWPGIRSARSAWWF